MISIERNISLKAYTTFGIEAKASHFVRFTEADEWFEIAKNREFQNLPRLILGGGSNLLFTCDFKGVIIYPDLKGITIESEDENSVLVKAMAGEVWDEFVEWAVNKNFGGIENLSLIPGHIGATPVQNIGAYGAEAKDTIEKVEGIDLETSTYRQLDKSNCQFGYRNSIFKHELKDKFLVTAVYFRLQKNPVPVTHYGNVEEELKNYPEKTIRSVRQAIIAIRRKKLPDPVEIGSAGSFFKNPFIPRQQAEDLKKIFPSLSSFKVSEELTKVSAAWLIDQCGWKGKRTGNVGVHATQPLVLVNYGNATGNEVLNLAKEIEESVYKKFLIHLDKEVIIIKGEEDSNPLGHPLQI